MRTYGTIAGAVAVVLISAVMVVWPAGAANVTVVQRGKHFVPGDLAIKSGDHIVFSNEDEVTHNVYSATPGLEFEIRIQQPGQSDLVRFTKAGVLEVHCAIHPKMKMRLTVAR
jgi:plastocyanin